MLKLVLGHQQKAIFRLVPACPQQCPEQNIFTKQLGEVVNCQEIGDKFGVSASAACEKITTVESRFLGPSVSRNSRKFEKKNAKLSKRQNIFGVEMSNYPLPFDRDGRL